MRLLDTSTKDPFELKIGFNKLNLVSTDSSFRTPEAIASAKHQGKNESMVVYKRLEFSNFHIKLTKLDSSKSGDQLSTDNLFKYTFDAFMKVRLSPKPDEP